MSRLLKVCCLPLALLGVVLYVLWLVLCPWPPEPDIDMKLVLIPAGKFMMGEPPGEHRPLNVEDPKEVEVKAFYMGAYEVTQGQYRKVMGTNPSCYSAAGRAWKEMQGHNTDDFPVEQVSWHDAQTFCKRLSAFRRERAAGRVYRLPTEAEWECACKAGTTTTFNTGNNITTDQANFDGRTPYFGEGGEKPIWLGRTTRVGSYPPNAWGLYDMHGNVNEWCQDLRTYPGRPQEGEGRVARGGDFYHSGWRCPSALSGSYGPNERNSRLGFRVACSLLTRQESKSRREGIWE